MIAITYQTKKLIDLFTERSYSKYAEINKSDLLYTLYGEVLIMLRPIRKYVYSYILSNVINSIVSSYVWVIIIFLIFNCIFESIILIILNFIIVKLLIQSSKEILMVAKTFDCFQYFS